MRGAAASMVLLALVGAAAPASELLPVASVELRREDSLRVRDRLVGRVVSRRRSELGFERGGRLERVTVDVGERVEEGQELAALTTRQLKANRRAVGARLESATSDLNSIRARLELASATRKRQDDLFERGVAAAQERDEALFGEQSLRAQLEAARSRIAAAQAEADQIDVELDLSVLTAPYAGTVTRRYFDEGSVIAAGAPVLALIDERREARIGVPLTQVRRLRIGETYEIEAEGRRLPAKLRAVVDAVDPATRTAEAVFDFIGPVAVVDGAVARMTLDSEVEESGYWVPTTALTEGRRGLWSVFVLIARDDTHVVERRDVQIVYVEPDRAYVRGALQEGERLAVHGVERVVPGQVVRAVDR